MTIRQILTEPDPQLRIKSKPKSGLIVLITDLINPKSSSNSSRKLMLSMVIFLSRSRESIVIFEFCSIKSLIKKFSDSISFSVPQNRCLISYPQQICQKYWLCLLLCYFCIKVVTMADRINELIKNIREKVSQLKGQLSVEKTKNELLQNEVNQLKTQLISLCTF